MLAARRVKTITVVPISWRGAAIGAIFLRTFRDGPSFSAADIQFCQVVANLTAKALRNAHRFERLQERRGEGGELRHREREQAALLGFLRRLLAVIRLPPPRTWTATWRRPAQPSSAGSSGVAQTVIGQEALAR